MPLQDELRAFDAHPPADVGSTRCSATPAEPCSDPTWPARALARAPGSACLVCGSTLTLQIRRGPDGVLDLLHCNHCGSEVPRRIRREETLAGRMAEEMREVDHEFCTLRDYDAMYSPNGRDEPHP